MRTTERRDQTVLLAKESGEDENKRPVLRPEEKGGEKEEKRENEGKVGVEYERCRRRVLVFVGERRAKKKSQRKSRLRATRLLTLVINNYIHATYTLLHTLYMLARKEHQHMSKQVRKDSSRTPQPRL